MINDSDLLSYNGRIAYLSSLNSAKKYLEIGVWGGSTFFSVEIPFKVAVDPCFVFDPNDYTKEGSHFYQVTSDKFFRELDQGRLLVDAEAPREAIKFDIIFIDGHHTFEQSFKDFENSLRYAHQRTLWLIDDTVPSDAYSAIPSPAMSRYKRRLAGLERGDWHGDVFKTIFAIHDLHPEISYCTLMGSNPQTVLWMAPRSNRSPYFSSVSEIIKSTYYDMIRHGKLLMPICGEDIPQYIFKTIDPIKDAHNDSWKQVITQPNFRNLSPEVSLADQFIVYCQESVASRAYRRLIKDGPGGLASAINRKITQSFASCTLRQDASSSISDLNAGKYHEQQSSAEQNRFVD
jgi:hypothetical protein